MRILGFACLLSIACSNQPPHTATASDDDDDANNTIANDKLSLLAVSLTHPASAATISASQSVAFEGTVSDPLQRWSDLIAYWTSDADGHIGEGPVDDNGRISLTVDPLSIGRHRIDVEVVDEPEGRAASDSIDLTVACQPEEHTSDHSWVVYQQTGRHEDPDTYLPLLADFPSTEIGTVSDGETLLSGNDVENAMFGLETWILATTPTTWNVSVTADDSVSLYVNDTFITGRANAEAPTVSGEVTVGCGWYQIRIIVYQGPGDYRLELSPTPSDSFDGVRSRL